MNTLVIGYGYKARQGKDTAIDAVLKARSKSVGGKYDVRRYGFADLLKKEVNAEAERLGGMKALFNVDRLLPAWVVYDENPDMSDPFCPLGKQRTLLQWWGTDYRRAKDPYYWIKALQRTLEIEKPQIALISDVRFKNEFYWVKSIGGRMVKVVRHGHDSTTINQHQSEVDLDGIEFDYTITVGDGEVEALKQSAIECYDMICAEFELPPDEYFDFRLE